MSDDKPQSPLREWRMHMAHPLTLTLMAGVSAVLGLAGPFGTIDSLILPARLAYWGAVVVSTYSVAVLMALWIAPGQRGWPVWLRIVGAGVPAGVCVLAVVILLGRPVFGRWPQAADLPGFGLTVIAITIIVFAVIEFAAEHLAAPAESAAARQRWPSPAPILARVPLEKRGALVALSVEDHYVRILTTKGNTLVLMRLTDAIGETGDLEGARVHRSHWAAFDRVTAARRDGDRAVLTMSTGDEIPVSRANVGRIREAGLLPR